MTALERADPSFTSRSPAEGHAVTPRAGFAGLAREHDVPDPALASSALVRRRSKAAIGDGELRGAVKELDMPIQGGSPQGLLRLPALTDRVIGDELRLGLLDLVLCEVLQGLRHDQRFRDAQSALLRFEVFATGGVEFALAAAMNYRTLRARGRTLRATIDAWIATFCLLHDHRLLHDDRDFDHFEQLLGLQVVHP